MRQRHRNHGDRNGKRAEQRLVLPRSPTARDRGHPPKRRRDGVWNAGAREKEWVAFPRSQKRDLGHPRDENTATDGDGWGLIEICRGFDFQ
jgi:hypothetical protein